MRWLVSMLAAAIVTGCIGGIVWLASYSIMLAFFVSLFLILWVVMYGYHVDGGE